MSLGFESQQDGSQTRMPPRKLGVGHLVEGGSFLEHDWLDPRPLSL